MLFVFRSSLGPQRGQSLLPTGILSVIRQKPLEHLFCPLLHVLCHSESFLREIHAVLCPLLILGDERLQAPEPLVLFVCLLVHFLLQFCIPSSTCMTDMEDVDLLLDLGLSHSSFLFFLLFALHVDIVFVFFVLLGLASSASSTRSVSPCCTVPSPALLSVVKKTFPFKTEISFKERSPSAATIQKCPCLLPRDGRKQQTEVVGGRQPDQCNVLEEGSKAPANSMVAERVLG